MTSSQVETLKTQVNALQARIVQLEERVKKLEKERDEAMKLSKTKGRKGFHAGGSGFSRLP